MDKGLAALLGATAREARRLAGLTQAEVAERIDLSPEVYGRIERGGMLPSVETLRRISRALAVPADRLLGLGEAPLPMAEEAPAPFRPDPELRRLLRRARALDHRRLRLLAQVAAELGRPRGGRPRKRSKGRKPSGRSGERE
ncbi:MAG: helix-turn-helix transcriptional regulator [Myxococcales bacterium]|nr:helix-turn-helix transcriptional regulator [Myxococcales bacterium]